MPTPARPCSPRGRAARSAIASGRAAADTAHSARVALEAAQEKLQGAQKRVSERVADKLPKWGKGDVRS